MSLAHQVIQNINAQTATVSSMASSGNNASQNENTLAAINALQAAQNFASKIGRAHV